MDKLTLKDYCDAAKELNCNVSAIKAVSVVESGGRSGFDEKGRLLIRFEGHHFRRFTAGRYDRSHPHLSYPYKNRFGKKHRYEVFNEALALDKQAAMLATSYGIFQPMGFNFEEMGFGSVDEMVVAFQTGERAQLDAFVKLIKRWGLDDELRRATLRDFQAFAKRYNGPDYKSNAYDRKMHDYFLAFERQGLKCPDKSSPFASLTDDEIKIDIPKKDPVPAADASIPASMTSSSAPAGDQGAEINSVAMPPVSPPESSAPEPEPVASAGDSAGEEPRWLLSIEDWKPFVFRWLARIWKGNLGGNALQISSLGGLGLKFGGDLWWIYLLVAGGIFLVTTALVVFGSLVLLAIWYLNRREQVHYRTLVAESIKDPRAFNLGLAVEKK